MIDITELTGITDLQQIKDRIIPESNGSYEIYVPKSTQLYFSDPENIAHDYACAAYSGQRLKEVSKMFEYEFVPPELHESILFTIRDVNPQELSKALLDISYQYVNDADEEMYAIDELNQFLDDAIGGKIEVACSSFIDVFKETIDGIEKDSIEGGS